MGFFSVKLSKRCLLKALIISLVNRVELPVRWQKVFHLS
ncbi:MAG: hypothetical protein RI973_1567 [Bacteroidota bacterium]|jgi:hypothetical protein